MLISIERNCNAPEEEKEEEFCVLCVLNKSIKLNILFICFIAHADNLIVSVISVCARCLDR